MSVVSLTVIIDQQSRPKTFCGRLAATLDLLIKSGERGITAFDNPGPRLSDYVFKLRKAGLTIETVWEKHSGPYAGEHGRYVLRTAVHRVSEKKFAHA